MEAANINPLMQFRSLSHEDSDKSYPQYECNFCEQTKASKITGHSCNDLKNGSVGRMNWD